MPDNALSRQRHTQQLRLGRETDLCHGDFSGKVVLERGVAKDDEPASSVYLDELIFEQGALCGPGRRGRVLNSGLSRS
jgi:hypothetical protein